MKNFVFKFTFDQKLYLIRLLNLCNFYNLKYKVCIEQVGSETEISDFLFCIEILGDNNVL